MFRSEWNDAEDAEVFVEHDDLRRRLDDLLREESQRDRSRYATGQTLPGWIIDASAVVRFQDFLCCPRLIWSAFSSSGSIIRGKSHRRRCIAPAATDSSSPIGF